MGAPEERKTTPEVRLSVGARLCLERCDEIAPECSPPRCGRRSRRGETRRCSLQGWARGQRYADEAHSGSFSFLFFLPLLRSFVSLEFDIYIYRLPGLFQRSPALSDLVSFAFFSRVLYFCRARRGRRKSIESPNPYILFLFVSFHSSLLGRFSGFGAGALAAVALFLFVVFCPLYARCRRKERASIQNALIECRLPALSLTISLAPLLASPLQCRVEEAFLSRHLDTLVPTWAAITIR